jgi:hypothetical protein
VSRFGFVWKIKLCSIAKEVHKFSQLKLVYLLVVVTLLLHSCGEITVVFNGLSILILFFPPTHPFFLDLASCSGFDAARRDWRLCKFMTSEVLFSHL